MERVYLEGLPNEVLDSFAQGCQVIGPDYRYLYVNETVALHARRKKIELVGRTMMDCFPGIEQTPMFATLTTCLRDGAPAAMENEFAYLDGTSSWFELRFFPIPAGVLILSLDITERKRADESLRRIEEQLRHLQKMEAVGRLAGGVAHDFNNLLSIVLSYSQIALAELPEAHPVRADLDEIVQAGQRAAELTRQLLTLSRQQVLAPRLVDLNDTLGHMGKMLRRLVGEDVELVVAPAPAVGRILVDPGQLEQVMMNLVVNARDAMPGGGKLTIETANVDLDDAYVREHLGVAPGAYVMVAVSDTGVGMEEATRSRIFEPFFTTKERGKGTGLGLSMVFGIVQQSGGHIWVYSEPGRGSTFKVYFPEARVAVEAAAASPAAAPVVGGSETILVVEDDAQVRALVESVLGRLGYRVLAASDGAEAIALAQAHAGAIDLLLTDVVMPRLGGPELFARLAVARPRLRALFMSGYAGEAIQRHGLVEAGMAFLPKPLTPDALAARIRAALDAP